MQEEMRPENSGSPKGSRKWLWFHGEELKSSGSLLARNAEPELLVGGRSTLRPTSICQRGVLSGILLGGGESPLQGEGPDGSTQPAKETRTGQCRAGAIRANLPP